VGGGGNVTGVAVGWGVGGGGNVTGVAVDWGVAVGNGVGNVMSVGVGTAASASAIWRSMSSWVTPKPHPTASTASISTHSALRTSTSPYKSETSIPLLPKPIMMHAANGVPLRPVSEIIGHSSYQLMADLHEHVYESVTDQAVRQLNRLLVGRLLSKLLSKGPLAKCQRAFCVFRIWWAALDSNQGPQSYQDCALTT
jgi:hypothetical protein